jgi:hypothetical protein
VATALAAKPIGAALVAAAAAKPSFWLRSVKSEALPGYTFRRTQRETCDSCKGNGRVNCGTCRASGKVKCHGCGGSGQERVRCNQCGGAGHHQRSRQIQVHTGSGYQWRTEYYNENCWNCGATGRVNARCSTCGGGGKVTCGTCRGSGRVTCRDCGGGGERDYLYTRTALISGRAALALGDVADEGWRALLQDRWADLIDNGCVTFANVRRKEGATSGELKVRFDATALAAAATARAGSASAQFRSIGVARPVVEGEPFLARIHDLPAGGEDADWVALADRMSGTPLLGAAVAAAETIAKHAVGYRTPEDNERAQRIEISRSLRPRLRLLLGDDGIQALENIVLKGVGALRERIAARVWRSNFAIALLAGILGGLPTIYMTTLQERVTDTWIAAVGIAIVVAPIVGRVCAAIGRRRVRARLTRLSEKLGLTDPLTPPRQGWFRRVSTISMLATFIGLCGTLYAAWSLHVPQHFRFALARQAAYIVGPDYAITLRRDAPLHQWPDPSSAMLKVERKGSNVRVYRSHGDWIFVAGDSDHYPAWGYIDRRGLDDAL